MFLSVIITSHSCSSLSPPPILVYKSVDFANEQTVESSRHVRRMSDQLFVCPICSHKFPECAINNHVNSCLSDQEVSNSNIKITGMKRNSSGVIESEVKRAKIGENNSTRVKESPGQTSAWGSLLSQKNRPTNTKPKQIKRESKTNKTNDVTILLEDSPDKKYVSNESDGSKHSTSRKNFLYSTGPFINGMGANNESKVPMSMSDTSHNNAKPKDDKKNFAPLAEQMRPATLEYYEGQDTVIGKGKLLRSLIQSHQIPSMILWGPPGCGKVINRSLFHYANVISEL